MKTKNPPSKVAFFVLPKFYILFHKNDPLRDFYKTTLGVDDGGDLKKKISAL